MGNGYKTLFHFAPHELSHSAFWGWVFYSLIRRGYDDGPLNYLAQSFLDSVGLSDSMRITDVNTEVTDTIVIEGEKRELRFDIIVDIDKSTCILIENKVTAALNPDQLECYNHILSIKSKKVLKKIFLFTSFDYGYSDSLKKYPNWASLNTNQIKEIFTKYDAILTHSMAREYYIWLESLEDEWNQINQKLGSASTIIVNEALSEAEGQWLLAKDIFQSPQNTIDGCLYNGINRDGSPWTQFCFYEIPRPPEGYNPKNYHIDNLFYRIDYSAKYGTYYFSLRQYLHEDYICEKYKDIKNIWTQKIARLERLREIFIENCAELQINRYFNLGVPSNRGKYESEIGLFLINRNNFVANLKKFIISFHKGVLLKMKADGWPIEKSLYRKD